MKTLEDMTRTTAALIPFQKSRHVVRFFKNCFTGVKMNDTYKDQFRDTFKSSVKQINKKWTWSNWRICDESEIENALFQNAWELLTSTDSLLSHLVSDVSTWNEFVRSRGNDKSRQISVDNVVTHINCITTADVSESCNTVLKMKETATENHFVLVPLEQVMFACILVSSMTEATSDAKDFIIRKYIVEAELDFSDKFALAAICKSPYVLDWLWHEDGGKKTTGLCHELALYMVRKVGSEDTELIQWLSSRFVQVEHKNSHGDTLLHIAASVGNLPLVERLLSKEADINVVNKAEKTPLHKAVSGGNAKLVQLILDKGAEIDKKDRKGSTPLMIAVLACKHGANIKTEDKQGTQTGNIEVLERLIAMGADVNKSRNKTGETPLHYACKYGQIEPVKMLLDAHGDTALTDNNGRTVLHEAALNSSHEIVEILLPKLSVPCINAQDHDGKTALHLAAEFNKDKNVVSALLKKGADTKIKSKDGKTAFDFAASNKHTEILDEFLKMN